MATSGEKIFTTGSTYVNRVKYTWTQTAVSDTDNTSTVKVTVKFYRTDGNSSTGYTININSLYVTVNGVKKSWISSKTTVSNTKSYSESFVIEHNEDGTKSFDLKFYCDTSAYNDFNDTTTYTLDPIERGSSIALSSDSLTINSTSGTFAYTITSTGNYYHVLTYGVNGTEATALSSQNINNTTYNGTVTYANLLNQVTSGLTGTVKFLLKTYADSAKTQLRGTRTVLLNVTINNSSNIVTPTVAFGTATKTNALSGNLVAGQSSLTIPRSTTLKSNATVSQVFITVSYSGNSATVTETTASGNISIGPLASSTSNYTLTVSMYCIDSRGVQSATVTTSFTVYAYGPPSITANIYRTGSSSSTGRDDGGEYVYFSFSATTSYSVNGQNSIQSVTCSYTGDIFGTATNGSHISLSATQTIDVVVTVTDKVRSYTLATITINRATHPLSLARSGSSMGVVFGGLATANNKVQSNLDMEVGGSGTSLSLKKNNSEVLTANDYWQTIWTGTLQGQSAMTLNMSAYSRIKVFFVSFASGGSFEVDLTQTVPSPQTSGSPYCGTGIIAYYASNRVETHICKVSVGSTKQDITNDWQGYYYGTTYQARNGNSSYYIYRIDAIK